MTMARCHGVHQRPSTRLHGGVMGPLRELLAIDHRQALEFFVLRLQDVSEPTVDRQELLYNASLLAHYAQVSTQPDVDVPAPANLSVVFDHFVAHTTLLHDRLMMETAGARSLHKARLLDAIARRFEPWRRRQRSSVASCGASPIC